MNPIVTTTNLCKSFGTTKALHDVNMTINRGDIYGFVGENGAGKSTLIRILTNLNVPSSGSFKIDCQNRLGSIAAIVENPSLHPSLSAIENLRYQCELLNLSKADTELQSLLSLVGLDDFALGKKPTRNFSLGMKQRLSIAMALLGNPEFILLDEPMNGLDPLGIKEMRDIILKLNAQGVTFLISSHILSELDKMATVYGFISKGKLLEEISSKALHEKAGNQTKISLGQPVDDKVVSLVGKIPFEIQGNTIILNNETSGQALLQTLVKNDITVTNFEVTHNSIEDYYFEVIKKESKI